MNLKKQQIKKVFTNLSELKDDGIWFDGIKKIGEFKRWWDNVQLFLHCFYNKEKEIEGEYKLWYDNGQLFIHCYRRGVKSRINTTHYIDESDKRFKDEYKEWLDNGKLKKHIIFNDDGSLKETIV